MPKSKSGKHDKLTHKQRSLLKGVAQGKTITNAARDAGYSSKNAGQLGSQALRLMSEKMPALLDKHGLTDDVLIEKYIKPLMDATETKFFAFRRTIIGRPRKAVKGKKAPEPVNRTVQVIESREVAALGIRRDAVDMVLRVKGHYVGEAENKGVTGVKVIVLDIARPDRSALALNVTPKNGTKPTDK